MADDRMADNQRFFKNQKIPGTDGFIYAVSIHAWDKIEGDSKHQASSRYPGKNKTGFCDFLGQGYITCQISGRSEYSCV